MPESPYKPPAAHVADPDAAVFSVWLTLAAGCAGYGAIFVVWTLVLPLWQQLLLAGGVPIGDINAALFGSGAFNIFRLVLVAAAAVIAGMLTVRFGDDRAPPLRHIVLSTLPMYAVFIGRYFGIYGGSGYPAWSESLAFLLPVPLALLGARLELRRAAAALDRRAQ